MNYYFDMDGTFVDFYSVDGWLNDLIAENTRPYEIAKPLVNMSVFARRLNKIQKAGNTINIISWCSKCGSADFNDRVVKAKMEWLAKHLPSVKFDTIQIVAYGTPKYTLGQGILFDDEKPNRMAWGKNAYNADIMLDILKGAV